MTQVDLTAVWIMDEQRKAARRLRIKQGIRPIINTCVSMGYSADEILDALRELVVEVIQIKDKWSVVHVAPDGTTDVVDTFASEAEAHDAAEYANQTRDAAQNIDGTIYEVAKVAL